MRSLSHCRARGTYHLDRDSNCLYLKARVSRKKTQKGCKRENGREKERDWNGKKERRRRSKGTYLTGQHKGNNFRVNFVEREDKGARDGKQGKRLYQ